MCCLRADRIKGRVAQRNRLLSSVQLLLKNAYSRYGMMKVMSGKASGSEDFMPQMLHAFDWPHWQKSRVWIQLSTTGKK